MEASVLFQYTLLTPSLVSSNMILNFNMHADHMGKVSNKTQILMCLEWGLSSCISNRVPEYASASYEYSTPLSIRSLTQTSCASHVILITCCIVTPELLAYFQYYNDYYHFYYRLCVFYQLSDRH